MFILGLAVNLQGEIAKPTMRIYVYYSIWERSDLFPSIIELFDAYLDDATNSSELRRFDAWSRA